MNVEQTMEMLDGQEAEKLLEALYGRAQVQEQKERYREVLKGYRDKFGDGEVKLFTSPGRTEISGNHTDHNHGKVLAGSINLDCVGAAAANHSAKVRIVSVTFGQEFTVDLNNLAPSRRKAGTEDLVKGLLKGFQESGYEVGGFDAYITSNVISAAGVSSSASFEMLLCSMINTLEKPCAAARTDRLLHGASHWRGLRPDLAGHQSGRAVPDGAPQYAVQRHKAQDRDRDD